MSLIQSSTDNDILQLTLTDEANGNALSPNMVEQLIEVIDTVGKAPPKAMVITGAGRHFCTGFDLSDLDTASDGDLLLRFVRIEQLLQSIRHAPFPTLAHAQGAAYGAGADIFAACRYRYCSPRAKFAFPGANFGLILGTAHLASLIGPDTAFSTISRNQPIRAEEALDLGLVSEIIEDDDLSQRIKDIVPPFTETTMRMLTERTRPDMGDADMAALVRSASAPGLKKRIAAYRQGIRAKKVKS